MKRIGRFLRVRSADFPDHKTHRWVVVGNTGDDLGVVHWLGAWRQYTFRADKGITFNDGCLRDLAAFLGEQTKAHRAVLKERG